jgi:hypothetical protein
MPGVTMNGSGLDAVPPGPVTATGPVEAPAGTVAVISEEDPTLNSLVAAPKLTPVTPANPEPAIVTPAPIVPKVGLTKLTTGAAASPFTGTSS